MCIHTPPIKPIPATTNHLSKQKQDAQAHADQISVEDLARLASMVRTTVVSLLLG